MHKVIMSGGDNYSGEWRSWSLSYPVEITDGGRSKSKRPRQSNDCTVRAIAIAMGLDYDDAYDWLAAEGRESWSRFNIDEFLKDRGARKISFPAVKGKPRMNPATFCKEFPKGRYICNVAKHVFAVVDGVVHDAFENRPNRCIYTAYEISA